MSEQAAETTTTEGAEDKEAVELPPHGDAAFGQLMDALAPEEGDATAGEGEGQAAAAPAGDGSAAPAGEGKPAAGGEPAAAGGGAAGEQGVEKPADASGSDVSGDTSDASAAGAEAQPGAGDLPAEWTATAEELAPKFGQLSTALEENVAKAYHQEALDEVREEHERYFEELEKHPRQLVGAEVPRIDGKEGMEVLRDADDAASWQEGVKKILVDEVKARAQTSLDENSDFLTTVHQSIEMFQNNPDLMPGAKTFDVELANKFTAFVKEFEIRDDEEKLMGYSVPVQPIINQLRSDLAAARAAAKPGAETAAAPASSNDTKPPAQQTPSKEDQPQAGITSKAGESAEQDDFSTLFGTISPELKDLRI